MNYAVKITSILAFMVAMNAFGATNKPEFWQKTFDATFKSLFKTSKNSLERGNFNDDALMAIIKEIKNDVRKDYAQFKAAFDVIEFSIGQTCGLIATLIKVYTQRLNLRDTIARKGIPAELVMLTFNDWKDLKEMTEGSLEKAQEQFSVAQKLLAKKKFLESANTKAMRSLLQHIIEQFEKDAFAKIVHDFQSLRDVTKKMPYQIYDQVKFVIKKIEAIDKNNIDAAKKWELMMNELGLAKETSTPDAIKKFDAVLAQAQGDPEKIDAITRATNLLQETFKEAQKKI